jgi:hypothetical protein
MSQEANYRSLHIADNPQLYTPARSNNFEFIITGIDRLVIAGIDFSTATEEEYIQNAQDVLRFSITESPIPNYELGTVEVKTGNLTTKFAGNATFSSGTLKFNDFIGAKTKDALYALQARAVNIANGGGVAPKEEYAFGGQLIEYNTDFSQILRKWELKGCWVKSISESPFQYENDDKRQVDVVIEYDRAIPKPVTITTE